MNFRPASRYRLPKHGISLSVVLAFTAAAISACGSSQSGVDTINPTQSTVTIVAPTPYSTQPNSQQATVPTVFDCGGGAYEPVTLLITCANAAKDATTTVTGIAWSSWSATSASGRGTVHLVVAGKPISAEADLTLGGVKETSNGLQFSTIELTWIGTSPDGNPTQQLPLAVAPSPS